MTEDADLPAPVDGLGRDLYNPAVLEEQVLVRRLDLEKEFPFPVAVGLEHEFVTGISDVHNLPHEPRETTVPLELTDRHLARPKDSEGPTEVLPQLDVVGVLVVKLARVLGGRLHLKVCFIQLWSSPQRSATRDDAAEPPTHDDGLPVRLLELEHVVDVRVGVELRVNTLGCQVHLDPDVHMCDRVQGYRRVLGEVVVVLPVKDLGRRDAVGVESRAGHRFFQGLSLCQLWPQTVDPRFWFQPADVRLPHVPELLKGQLASTDHANDVSDVTDVPVQFREQQVEVGGVYHLVLTLLDRDQVHIFFDALHDFRVVQAHHIVVDVASVVLILFEVNLVATFRDKQSPDQHLSPLASLYLQRHKVLTVLQIAS